MLARMCGAVFVYFFCWNSVMPFAHHYTCLIVKKMEWVMKKQGKDDDDKKCQLNHKVAAMLIRTHASRNCFVTDPQWDRGTCLLRRSYGAFFYQENVFIFIIFYSLAIVLPVGNSISWFFLLQPKIQAFFFTSFVVVFLLLRTAAIQISKLLFSEKSFFVFFFTFGLRCDRKTNFHIQFIKKKFILLLLFALANFIQLNFDRNQRTFILSVFSLKNHH